MHKLLCLIVTLLSHLKMFVLCWVRTKATFMPDLDKDACLILLYLKGLREISQDL